VYTNVYRHLSKFLSDAGGQNEFPNGSVDGSPPAGHLAPIAFATQVKKDIYFVLPFRGSVQFKIPIRFVAQSHSAKSTKNVFLHAELADSIYCHNLERHFNRIGAAREMVIAADKGRNEYIAQVLYKIPSIPPNTRLEILDFIFPRGSTVLPVKTKAVSKDKVPLTILSKILYFSPIILSLDAEDLMPRKTVVNVHFRKGRISDLEGVKRHEDKLIKEMKITEPSEATFIGFTKFVRTTEYPGLDIYEAEPQSITGYNVVISGRGLQVREKLRDW
jgi:hypothetical protein